MRLYIYTKRKKMKISKIAEWIGFAMIVIAFILWLAADLDYVFLAENTVKVIGLVGTIIWCLGYLQNEKEKKNLS